MKTQVIFILIALLLQKSVFAQNVLKETSIEDSEQIYLEADPTAFLFNGFSIVVRKSSVFHEKLILGIGLYQVDLPDFYIESVATNKGKGWSVKNFGVDMFVDFFVQHPNKGLSVGFHAGYYTYEIERLGQRQDYQSLVETMRVGYLWRPLNGFQSLYLYPWLGISTGQIVSGTNEIAGVFFNMPQWSIVPSVQIGFSF